MTGNKERKVSQNGKSKACNRRSRHTNSNGDNKHDEYIANLAKLQGKKR